MIKGVLVGLLVAAPACAAGGTLLAQDPGTPVPSGRPVVMVSGRHCGEAPASEVVRVASAPDGPVTGMVAPATLADVVRTQDGWLEVETLTGPPVRGWIAQDQVQELPAGTASGCS